MKSTDPEEFDGSIEARTGRLKTATGSDSPVLAGCKGTWPKDCNQRAFVAGAAWWQNHKNMATMFSSERTEAETEAINRYGEPL